MPAADGAGVTDHAFRRRAQWVLLAGAACLPVFAALAAGLPVNNDVDAWLPAGDPQRVAYARFVRTFGSEEAVLVGLPAAADPARVESLRRRLDRSPRLRHAASPASTGAVMGRFGVCDAQIAARHTGLLRSGDGCRIAVAAGLSEAGVANRTAAVADVRAAVAAAGLSDVAQVAGMPVVVAELDRLSHPSAVRPYLLGMLAAGLLVLKWVCRRWALALCLGGAVGWAVLGTLAAVRVAGGEMNLILAACPAVVLVVALTACVHLLHHHAAAGGVRADRVRRAVGTAAAPTLWATATTAAGLLSLTVSDVRPVAQFGLAGAVGTALSAVCGLLFAPAAVAVCGGLPRLVGVPSRWPAFGRWVTAHRRRVLAGGAALTLLAGAGLPGLSAKLDPADLLPAGGTVLADHRAVTETLTPAASVEVVLRPPAGSRFTRSLDRVRTLGDRLASHPDVRHVLSAASMIGDVGGGLSAAATLSEARDRPEAEAFVTADGSAWRISVRADCPPGERGRVMAELRALCGDETVTFTGLSPLMETAEVAIHAGFRESVTVALLVVALAVVLACGRWRTFAAVSAVNLVPLAAVFGLLGWARWPVDVGMMMTASVALGLAVDGAFHLLTHHRRAVRAGLADPAAAAVAAAGPAVAQAALIAGAGVLALTVSPFRPIARFGWLTAALLAAAVAAELLLLPALLAAVAGTKAGIAPPAGRVGPNRPHFLRAGGVRSRRRRRARSVA